MQVKRLSQPENLHLTVCLGRGGEACIYAVPENEHLVAKIYHKPNATHVNKLQVMLAHPPEDPTASLGHISIAWPKELLKAVDGSDHIIGFLMPRIQGMLPIMDLYNPGIRRQNCPLFNYQYLLRTARNLAAAFAALHASHYCIGDVNESNILVSNTALVTLLDTDSFQVSDPQQNIVYRCVVGKPEFTPPELQNKTFSEHDRQTHHDLFGLAVLIFQLLMEGTHPFSGIFQGSTEPPPYETRIIAGHFTYSQNRQVPYKPSPIAPPWEILPVSLQNLFLRCFEVGHVQPHLRPNAQNWLAAIAEAEASLITCSENPQHFYNDHLQKCPWCERSLRLGGRDPFPSLGDIAAGKHLQPRKKLRQRYSPTPLTPKQAVNRLTAHHWPVFAKNSFFSTNHRKLKPQIIIASLLGFGLFSYLDVVIKFTRPFISPNPYTQERLMARTENTPVYNPQHLQVVDYYQQGKTAYGQKDYELAIENFGLAIQNNHDDDQSYIGRANARYNIKDYEGALSDYDQALRLNPHNIQVYTNRGNTHYMLADYSSDPSVEYNLALFDYNKAIGYDNNQAEAYIRRGIIRFQLAKYSSNFEAGYEAAISDLNQAIAISPSYPEAYFQRGLVRYQMAQYSSDYITQYKGAISDFDQSLSINPHQPKVYIKRGMVYYELSQYGIDGYRQSQVQAIGDLQTAAKESLEKEDMENYQQAINNFCLVLENKCDSWLKNSTIDGKYNLNIKSSTVSSR